MSDDTKDNVRTIRPDIKYNIPTEDQEQTPPPNEKLVEILTLLKEHAEQGILQEIAFVTGYCDESIGSALYGDCGNEDGMLADLVRLQMMYAQQGFVFGVLGEMDD